jgi:hypothetical protein
MTVQVCFHIILHCSSLTLVLDSEELGGYYDHGIPIPLPLPVRPIRASMGSDKFIDITPRIPLEMGSDILTDTGAEFGIMRSFSPPIRSTDTSRYF